MKKVLIFGGEGLVGSKFLQLNSSYFDLHAPTLEELNLFDEEKVKSYLENSHIDVVLNFAAYTNVEQAEDEKGDKNGIVYKLNSLAPKKLAAFCRELDKRLVQISTEYVFDGRKVDEPYTEKDQPNPINWYGATKYFGEQFVADSGCKFTIVRISMPYSAHYELKRDIARFFLGQLKNQQEIKAIEDAKNTPVLVDDIANALKMILEREPDGLIHVTAKDSITPFGFVSLIAEKFALDKSLVKPIRFEEYSKTKKAPLLQNSWLSPANFEMQFGSDILHTIEEGVNIFKKQIDIQP